MIEIEIDHSVEIKKDKTLDPTIGDNHKIDVPIMDVTIGEDAIDAKIMVLEVTVEIELEYILEETSVMTGMTVEIGIGVEQEKEASHLEEMTEDITAQMQI